MSDEEAPRKAKPEVERKPVEQHQADLGTEYWLFAAARQKFHWPIGQELTRADYEAALKATLGEVIR